MNTYPSRVIQEGKTEFWEEMVDKRLEEYQEISEGIRVWKPIDMIQRKLRLKRLEEFIMRATVIVKESREVDELLTTQHAVQEVRSTTRPNEPVMPSFQLSQIHQLLAGNPEIA